MGIEDPTSDSLQIECNANNAGIIRKFRKVARDYIDKVRYWHRPSTWNSNYITSIKVTQVIIVPFVFKFLAPVLLGSLLVRQVSHIVEWSNWGRLPFRPVPVPDKAVSSRDQLTPVSKAGQDGSEMLLPCRKIYPRGKRPRRGSFHPWQWTRTHWSCSKKTPKSEWWGKGQHASGIIDV